MADDLYQMDPVSRFSAQWIKQLIRREEGQRVYQMVPEVAGALKRTGATGLKAIYAQNNYWATGAVSSAEWATQMTMDSCSCYYDDDGALLFRRKDCTYVQHAVS